MKTLMRRVASSRSALTAVFLASLFMTGASDVSVLADPPYPSWQGPNGSSVERSRQQAAGTGQFRASNGFRQGFRNRGFQNRGFGAGAFGFGAFGSGAFGSGGFGWNDPYCFGGPGFFPPIVYPPVINAWPISSYPTVIAPNAWTPNVWAPNAWTPNAGAPNVWAPNAWAPNVWAPQQFPIAPLAANPLGVHPFGGAPMALPPVAGGIANRGAGGIADGIDLGQPHDGLDEIRRRVAVLKPSNAGGRMRADRLISSADEMFAEGNYSRAVARYRDAIAKAPDYAEGHFRLAHAYVATRRFNLGLTHALMALELAGSPRRDGFSLEEMYRGAKLARQQHDELLVDAINRQPEDGGLMFLLAFTYHYGDRPLEARQWFDRSNRFPGAHRAFTRHFLPLPMVAEE